jgi:phage I-like protein
MTKDRRRIVAGKAMPLEEQSSPVYETTPAPAEFLIWAFGSVDCVHFTDQGLVDDSYTFDESAGAAVMARWQDYGNRLSIDYDHLATKGGRAGDGKAAGSFVPELREDGLYATAIRWTPTAAQEISDGEWLYFSPVFAFDEDGRIIALINIALTNVPATKNLQPLVAASAIAALVRTSSPMGGQKGASMSDDEKTEAETAAEKEECAAAAPPAGEDDEAPPSSKNDEDEDLTEEETALALAEFKAKKAKLKLKAAEEAAAAPPPTAALAAANINDPFVGELMRRTGAKTPAEALGIVSASVAAAKEVGAVSNRLSRLEKESREREVKSIIRAAITSGKVGPRDDKMLAHLSAVGRRDVDELRGYVSAMPKRVVTEETREASDEAVKDNAGGVAQLTATERLVCERMGHDPKEFAKIARRPIRYAAG